jgi:geranylgeranyl pyrophosphate synthase
VGLAQNLGALRALAAEGIQQGHMRVHARNVAVAAGATEGEVDRLAQSIADQRTINRQAARRELQRMRAETRDAWEPGQVGQRMTRLRERHLDGILALIREAQREDLPRGSRLLELCDYQLSTGGKRLRALLPLLVAEALGVEEMAPLLPFAAACEVLHNATLVHDDLQDGDRTRRGRPTVWSQFGEARAINLGDALFHLAHMLLHRLDLPLHRRLSVERRLMQETLRVLDGQEQELSLLRDSEPGMERYVALAQAKTSGLFALPMAGAAAICGAPAELVSGLQEAAGHLGLLFQIQDDLLDLYGDKGRGERGADLREGKRSVLVVHALQHAPAEDARWLRGLLDRPHDRRPTADEVQAAAALLQRLGSPRFALDQMEAARRQASAVAGLTDHRPLRALVDGVAELLLQPIASLRDR